MIEKPPLYKVEKKTFPIMMQLQKEGFYDKVQDEYFYWDKIKYKKTEFTPVELWRAIKLYRSLRSSTLSFLNYDFNLVITDYMQRALHLFDLNIGGTLGSNIGIAETDKNRYIISSIMEEAISSSQMEGANTTRKKVKEMIQQEKKPKNKSELMVMNNFFTMQYIIQHKDEEISSEKILYIHKLISQGTLDSEVDEGKYRDNNEVFVVNHSTSEIVHTPPDYSEIPKLINALCKFCNSEGNVFIHPIVKASVVHFMLGWIHPFSDGNGRTARALFYWYMLKKGYWMAEYLSISRIIMGSKTQYEKAYLYTEMDGNDLSYFVTYHIKTLEKSIEALKAYISRKQKEVFQAAKFMKIPGINERMAQLLKIVYDDPDRIFTIKEVEARFDVSDYTARQDLKFLVERGFLEIIQVNLKKQNFIRTKNFEKNIKKLNL